MAMDGAYYAMSDNADKFEDTLKSHPVLLKQYRAEREAGDWSNLYKLQQKYEKLIKEDEEKRQNEEDNKFKKLFEDRGLAGRRKRKSRKSKASKKSRKSRRSK
jgi:hypothetical protein